MDEAVNKWLLAAALLLAGPALAHAQELQDPTRPPAQFEAHGGGTITRVSAAPQLQSVLIAREAGGRRVAVIDGETVRQGESFRGARVARVGPEEVELVRGGERQVLKLYSSAGSAAAAMAALAAPAAAAPAAAQP